MKITLRCGSVLRAGPERELVDKYIKRANGLAGTCGFHSVREIQIDLKKSKTRTEETEKLLQDIPPGALLILMDERGKDMPSRKIAKFLQNKSLDGISEVIFVIGGADGFEPGLIPNGSQKWSFGSQTWPHKMVRVMLAEQMYRALSILSGSPYHRD